MRFKTHVVFGLLCGLFLFSYFANSLIDTLLFFVFVFLGCVFPDVDISNSWFNRTFKLGRVISVITKHRGVFHSLFVAVPLSYLLYLWSHLFGFAFFFGYLSHLFLDGLNHAGINFIHPFSKFHFHGFIETGSVAETILFIFLLVAVLLRVRLVFF